MNELIWAAAVGAAFGAGEWWGRHRTVSRVAQLLAAGILRWEPGRLVVRPGKEGDE